MRDDEHKNSVAKIQDALRKLYLNGENVPEIFVDGIFGKETTEAVKAFQKNAGFEPTGEVDYETWSLLMEKNEFYSREPLAIKPFKSNEKSMALPGERKPPVYFAQAMLLLASADYSGFDGIEINGINADETLSAIRRIQEQDPELRKDGALDLDTWNSIVCLYDCCTA